ncbi:hypothetical protein ACFSKL_12455 [Belliella marina]|uniref:Lipoprotein n=1 Tax=Belliella marina TaxID=1644146 RepID=A0ABW4VPH5_9BACT
MRHTTLIFLLTAFLFSCKKSEESTTEIPETKIKTGCYFYESNGSVAGLKINQTGDIIQGELVYAILEKDQNFGKFSGKIENGLLTGDYEFTSEGMESKRQVAFQISEGKLTEGFGEVIVNEKEATFKDPSKLDFDNGLVFLLTDCEELESNCFFDKDAVKSNMTNTCITPKELGFKLNQMEVGAMKNGNQVYLHFDENAENAEIFLPNSKNGIILKKTSEGNWSDGSYLLFAWKGFVLQKDGKNIYAGGD